MPIWVALVVLSDQAQIARVLVILALWLTRSGFFSILWVWGKPVQLWLMPVVASYSANWDLFIVLLAGGGRDSEFGDALTWSLRCHKERRYQRSAIIGEGRGCADHARHTMYCLPRLTGRDSLLQQVSSFVPSFPVSRCSRRIAPAVAPGHPNRSPPSVYRFRPF